MMPRRLNGKLLFGTLAGMAVLTGVVHVIHSCQVQRHAGVMLRQAQRAFEQKDFFKSAELLQRYLDLEPNDTEAMALFASALEEGPDAASARFKTYLLLEQVLRRLPDRNDLRRRAVQAAIDVGRLPDAIRHLQHLLSLSPGNAELEQRLGWCLEASGEYDESAKAFSRAIAAAPEQVDSYALLAELLARRLEQADEAAKVMDALVAANSEAWQAYLARARFHQRHGRLEPAAADIFKAAELAPQQPEVIAIAAAMALLEGNIHDASGRVNNALELDPKNEHLYRSLATLQSNGGHTNEAITSLQRGLSALPDSVGLHVHLAEVLLDTGDKQAAGKLIEWIQRSRPAPGLVDYLDGRMLMLEGQWPNAIEKLKTSRAALGEASEWASNLCACLGKCHERLGEVDQQVTAYRDAVVLNPNNMPARLQFGKALLAARLPEEAVLELRDVTGSPQAPPQSWATLAKALLDRYQRRTPAAADWKDLDAVLKKAAEDHPDAVEISCLHAERLFLLGEGPKAVATLKNTVAEHSKDVRAWIALAGLQSKTGQDAQCLTTLGQAQTELGVRLEICRALVGFWAPRGGPEARKGLAHVANQVAHLPPDAKVLLLRELGGAVLLNGDHRQAENIQRQIAVLLPKDLSSRVALFDLLLHDNRESEAALLVVELRRLEGEDGVQWRAGEAALGIWKARKGDATQLDRVRERLAEIQKRRGDWGRAYLLEGYLQELAANAERAMESYRRAFDLGERPSAIVLRIAQWLASQYRFSEAGQVLRQLDEWMPLSREEARWAAEIALQNDEPKRALALAHKAVPPSSRDYRDKLWLAHLQWLAAQPLEAEETLREAVKLAPRVPEVWVALVQHLSRTKLSKRLEDALEEMAQKIPSDRADLTRAGCLEAAGNLAEAEACYQKALAANPDDLAAVRQVAEFHLRADQPAKAEPLLRQLLLPAKSAPADLAQWARRQLAIVLVMARPEDPATTGGDHATTPESDLDQALALLDQNVGAGGQLIEDQRLRAFVLSKARDRQAEAVRLFEETLAKQSLTPDEQFLLAQVYDANHEDGKANRLMRILLVIHRHKAQYLAYHIRTLLNRGEVEAAWSYLNALELLEPSTLRTQQLRAAYQKARAAG
jgi:cellulose synthase operon protein C